MVDLANVREYNFRESLSALKRLSQTDRRWGVTIRTTANQIARGHLTPEELVKKLTCPDRERQTP